MDTIYHSEAVTILKKAKQVLAEKGWTQGAFAHDGRGRLVDYSDRTAVQFCMLGALYYASDVDNVRARSRTAFFFYPAFYHASRCLTKAVRAATDNSCGDPTIFNDMPRRTKADCLKVYDTAIALAEEEEA